MRRLAVLFTLLAFAAPASAAAAPQGATWSETWIDTPDGECAARRRHAARRACGRTPRRR